MVGSAALVFIQKAFDGWASDDTIQRRVRVEQARSEEVAKLRSEPACVVDGRWGRPAGKPSERLRQPAAQKVEDLLAEAQGEPEQAKIYWAEVVRDSEEKKVRQQAQEGLLELREAGGE